MFCGLCQTKKSKRKKEADDVAQNGSIRKQASAGSATYHVMDPTLEHEEVNADLYELVGDKKTRADDQAPPKKPFEEVEDYGPDLYDAVDGNDEVVSVTGRKECEDDDDDDISSLTESNMVRNIAYEPFRIGSVEQPSTNDEQDIYDLVEDGGQNNGRLEPTVPLSRPSERTATRTRVICKTMPRIGAPDMGNIALSAASKGKELLSRRKTSPGASIKSQHSYKRHTSSESSAPYRSNQSVSVKDDVFAKRNSSVSVNLRTVDVEINSLLSNEFEDNGSAILSTETPESRQDETATQGNVDVDVDKHSTAGHWQNKLNEKPAVSRKPSVKTVSVHIETEICDIVDPNDDVTNESSDKPQSLPQYENVTCENFVEKVGVEKEVVNDKEENREELLLTQEEEEEEEEEETFDHHAITNVDCGNNNTIEPKETDSSPVKDEMKDVRYDAFVFFTPQSLCKFEEDIVTHETLNTPEIKYVPITNVKKRKNIRRFSL